MAHVQQTFDYVKKKAVLKIIIVGESGVGKTALSWKFVDDRFIEQHKATIGADLMTKSIDLPEHGDVLLQIWDTAGQERFQSMSSAFWRGANGCIVVYDITSKESFEAVSKWRDSLLREIDTDRVDAFPLLLIGNKCDLSDEYRQVPTFDAKHYAQHYGMLFWETSAKSGININHSVRALAKAAMKVYRYDVPYLEPSTRGDQDLFREELEELEKFEPAPVSACGSSCELL